MKYTVTYCRNTKILTMIMRLLQLPVTFSVFTDVLVEAIEKETASSDVDVASVLDSMSA